MSTKYPQITEWQAAKVQPLDATVFHGAAISGHTSGDSGPLAIVAPDADAAERHAQSFGLNWHADGAQRCVLISEKRFAELLALAGQTEAA